MPRGKNGKPVEGGLVERSAHGPLWVATDADWGGYVNIRLSDDAVAEFELWSGAPECDWWGMYCELVAEGARVTCVSDPANDCYIMSATTCGWHGGTSRWTLQARAESVQRAAALLVYKHYIVAEGDWGKWKTGGQGKWSFG